MRRRFFYPLVGFVLAWGAPLGLLALRLLLRERATEAVTYAYLLVSTTLVFGFVGWWLGTQEDLLRTRATTDPLTGLANRRHFDAELGAALARAHRHPAPVSILMIDVDGLKPINDEGGHQAGDRALRLVARALVESCRRSDVVARHGGDEFAVLLPHTRAEEALALADRIRKTLADLSGGKPTVSIGVADNARARGPGVRGLLVAADEALYAAKESGRDRAVLAPERASSESAIARPLLHRAG